MKNGKLVFLILSLCNLIFVYGFLFLLGLVSDPQFLSNQELISISIFTTSMQLAQAVSHQSVVSGNCLSRNFILLIMFIISTVAVILKIVGVYIDSNELEGFIFPILLGVICSIKFGFDSGRVLVRMGAFSFQRLLFMRNAIIYPSFFLIVFFQMNFEYWYFLVFIVNSINTLSKNNIDVKKMNISKTANLKIIFLGLFASAIYRNDINIVRQVIVDSENFIYWHYLLISFSLFSALLGYIITNAIYPNKEAFIAYFVENKGKIEKIGVVFILIFILMLQYVSNCIYFSLPIMYFLISNTLFSTKLHIEARSNIVYTGAVVSFLIFLVMPFYLFDLQRTDLNASRFFSSYLCMVALIFISSHFLTKSQKHKAMI